MRVLVVGATGRLSRPVTLRLREEGYDVRVLTRYPQRCNDLRRVDIEVAAGDLAQPATLAPVFANCDIVYIGLRAYGEIHDEPLELMAVKQVLESARTAGVQRIAYLSHAGKENGNDIHAAARVRRACERMIEQSGLTFTIFRVTHFMESLPSFVRGPVAEVMGRQSQRYHYVAVDDVARMLAQAFSEPEVNNRTVTVFGPDAYTLHDALRIYLDHVHRGMEIKTRPLALLRAVARLTGNRELRAATDQFASFADLGEEGDPRVANELLGKPSITLTEWSKRRA